MTFLYVIIINAIKTLLDSKLKNYKHSAGRNDIRTMHNTFLVNKHLTTMGSALSTKQDLGIQIVLYTYKTTMAQDFT